MAPPTNPAQTRVDPVALASEQSIATRPTGRTTGEPSVAGPASPGGELHDESDPGAEEMEDEAATSSGLAGATMEPMGDVPSSAAQGSPMAAEQAPSIGASIAEAMLGRPVRALQQPRRASVLVVTIDIEEIVRETTLPPQLLCTVIQRGEEFEMLEEVEVSVETKKLRANLTSMMGHIEVILKRSYLSFKEHSLLIHLPTAECDEGVRAVPAVAGGDDSSTRGE